VLFKLLWPDATIVSVEPNPKNFETLQKNTASFKNVHPINAGLWGKKAKIGQIGNHGEWGLVFQEVSSKDKDGMQAYGVWDLARMHNIPAFDFIKIDIEGAEGQVFAPGADISWIDKASVISLEIHDFFHGYFNLGEKDISTRIASAFERRPYGVATDNEHTIFAKYSLLKTLI
jgi:FkbM family methyltransferase